MFTRIGTWSDAGENFIDRGLRFFALSELRPTRTNKHAAEYDGGDQRSEFRTLFFKAPAALRRLRQLAISTRLAHDGKQKALDADYGSPKTSSVRYPEEYRCHQWTHHEPIATTRMDVGLLPGSLTRSCSAAMSGSSVQ